MHYQNLDFNITCIDTKHIRDNFVACYLVESNYKYALIDSGVGLSVSYILKVMADKNINLDNIVYIMPTHCHLDHAGGVSELLKHTVNAKVIAHPSCAKHLVNPKNLQNAVIKVYGKDFLNTKIGKIYPIDKDRIILANNQIINLGNRKLQLMETYGHAYHHYVVYDELSNGIFSGDTLGVSYKELNTNSTLIFPPTTPTQFDPDNWLKTIDKLTNLGINKAYLTHYNKINWDKKIATQLKRRIKDFCIIAKSCKNDTNRISAITQKLINYLNNNFNAEQIKTLKADVVLCAKGLNYWLDQG